MTKDDIKDMIKQAITQMALEVNAVGNTTGNVAGYDGPLGPKIKRKLKDFEFADEDKEKKD